MHHHPASAAIPSALLLLSGLSFSFGGLWTAGSDRKLISRRDTRGGRGGGGLGGGGPDPPGALHSSHASALRWRQKGWSPEKPHPRPLGGLTASRVQPLTGSVGTGAEPEPGCSQPTVVVKRWLTGSSADWSGRPTAEWPSLPTAMPPLAGTDDAVRPGSAWRSAWWDR